MKAEPMNRIILGVKHQVDSLLSAREALISHCSSLASCCSRAAPSSAHPLLLPRKASRRSHVSTKSESGANLLIRKRTENDVPPGFTYPVDSPSLLYLHIQTKLNYM